MKAGLLASVIIAATQGGSFLKGATFLPTLQLVVHLPLLNVLIPDNAGAYLEGISRIATYDVFWSDEPLGPDHRLDSDPNIDSAFY